MFNLKDKFEFLEDGVDFPFYNDVPKLSGAEWLMLLLSVILMIAYITIKNMPFRENYFPLILFLLGVVPALYICKGNYGLFFKIPRLKDIKLILGCVIGNYLYVFIVALILLGLGIQTAAHAGSSAPVTLAHSINQLIQLWGEEFLKIFVLLLVMFGVYKFTNNRKLSLMLGVVVSLFLFGLLHCNTYGGKILQVLLIQGLGSIFELYAYLKTKNVVVSYIIHVIVDLIPDIVHLLGLG